MNILTKEVENKTNMPKSVAFLCTNDKVLKNK